MKIEKGYSKHTLIAYQDDLLRFQKFLLKLDQDMTLEEVIYPQIRSWIVSLIENGMTHRSVNRKLSSLKSFYKFLLKTAVIGKNPLIEHRSLKIPKKILVPFSQKEMEQLKELYPKNPSFENSRDKLMLELLYTTGMRKSELIGLHISDINIAGKQIKVFGKRKKERYIPLLDYIINIILEYLTFRKKIETTSPNLFITKNGKPLYDSFVYKKVKHFMTLVSSKEKRGPHILRHAFATHLIDEGSDLNTVKELLGHASLASTQVYTHNSLERIKEVYRKSHPRNK